MMTHASGPPVTVAALGDEERALVRLAAVIAAGSEPDIRAELARAQQDVRVEWIRRSSCSRICLPVFPGR